MQLLKFEAQEKLSNAEFFKDIQKFVESFIVMCVFHQAFWTMARKSMGHNMHGYQANKHGGIS